jgi:pilus assembly protein Flp/PilA
VAKIGALSQNENKLSYAVLPRLQERTVEIRSPERTRLHCHIWEARLKHHILKFLSDESGATAIEYGLIAAGISVTILAVVNGLGTNLNTKFTSINTSLK